MKNGLYSVHIQMGDGVRGRASGVIVLRDGAILGGDPYFWSVGSYTVGNGTWKGCLVANQHTPYHDSLARPVFAGREVTTGFSGTFRDDGSEVFGTSLVGTRSISFRATLRRLADN
jgi:T3SS negative regulator,GrlR